MGWFSNPKCPRCGRESSIATAWDGDYYTCHPCNRKAREEKREKEALEARVAKLEEKYEQDTNIHGLEDS